jgi:hypothetical protein
MLSLCILCSALKFVHSRAVETRPTGLHPLLQDRTERASHLQVRQFPHSLRKVVLRLMFHIILYSDGKIEVCSMSGREPLFFVLERRILTWSRTSPVFPAEIVYPYIRCGNSLTLARFGRKEIHYFLDLTQNETSRDKGGTSRHSRRRNPIFLPSSA